MAHAMEYNDSACAKCGIEHYETENHEYNYKDAVDEELNCQICLSPLVDPLDTKCGHTFCRLCITQTVESMKMCPLDRKPAKLEDLRETNYAFKRMLHKLKVQCPNFSAGIERGNLEDHIAGCVSTHAGCVYDNCNWFGSEEDRPGHVMSCQFNFKTAPIEYGQRTAIEFEIEEGERLGFSVVGGNETPLVAIIIQEIFPTGAARRDMRLHAGDIILEVNGIDTEDVQHQVAVKALLKAKGRIRLTVYREQKQSKKYPSNLEQMKISIMKNKGIPLGITIDGEKKKSGVFIVYVKPNSVASRDGRLKLHDEILEVNGRRVNHLTAARVSEMFKKSHYQINLLIAREMSGERREDLNVSDSLEDVATHQPLRQAVIPRARTEKTVVIHKRPSGDLGMELAGGRETNANLPVFILTINPDGNVGRSGKLKAGDIILAVNGKQLTDSSLTDCLEKVQNASKNAKKVYFTVIEADDVGTSETANVCHPSWLKWLTLPRQFENRRKILLRKTKDSSLGFAIIGGIDSSHGRQPIFVQSITPEGVADQSKLLKCGDIIVKVNDTSLMESTQKQALHVLRGVKEKAELTIKSWPGTFV